MKTCHCFPLLIALTGILSPLSAGDPSVFHFKLIVTNYDAVWNYSLKPESPKPVLLSSAKKKFGSDCPPELATVLKECQRRANNRVETAQKLKSTEAHHREQWAELSPDCAKAASGPEKPTTNVVTSLSIVKLPSGVSIYESKIKPGNYILDFCWSEDSRYFMFIETDVRESKSLTGRFFSAIGHGIPLGSLYGTVVDTTTGETVSISSVAGPG